MSDNTDRRVDQVLADLGLSAEDVGPQAVAALRLRMATDTATPPATVADAVADRYGTGRPAPTSVPDDTPTRPSMSEAVAARYAPGDDR